MSHPKTRSPVSLSEVIDSVPAILWTADPATLTFTWVSSGAESILGYPLAEWMQPDFWRDHIHPDDRHVLSAVHAKDLTERELVYRMITADGRIVWLRDCVRALSGELSGFMIDITSERAAHDALARSEENYRRLVHMMPDGIGVHTKGRFIYVNPKFIEIFGAQHESDLIGREVLSLVHPDFREIVRNRLVRVAVGENVPVTREKLIRVDGRRFEAEVLAIPVVFNGANAVQVVVRDVSEQIKTAERLELLAAGTNEAIWEGDFSTNEFWTNDRFREIFGTATDIVTARQIWTESLHHEDRDRVLSHLQQRIDAGVTAWSEEYRIRDRAGNYIWILERGKRILDENGKPLRVIGAMLDVSALRLGSGL